MILKNFLPKTKMIKRHQKYALFIGRWQPFHLGHKHIVDKALQQGKNVAIAVRETELSDKNPFTVEQRMEMIKKVYGDKVKVFPICDVESINIGRKVGYEVNRIDAPDEIKKISGTKERKEVIPTNVPEEVRAYIASVSPTFWFFGLPCSGKSTLAKELEKHFLDKNRRVFHLDGDLLRSGLNKDLGFSPEDREENLRRAAHLAKMLNETGHMVMCSFITPTKKTRDMVRDIIPNVTMIYTKCSLEECKRRDVKGMYERAERGEIKNFTGVDAPFEEPEEADIVVDTEKLNVEESIQHIIEKNGGVKP